MAVVNQVLVEMLSIVERGLDLEVRAGTQITTSSMATSTSAAATAIASPSPSNTSGNTSSNGPTSSPLLFFVALGFGVVFTNLWIIVGVKYCFRYNARNRQMRVGEDGEPINLENMPRPHRRRREKKLMSMDEVNERFPLTKYKNWVMSRASEGLPTAGGVTAPVSRASSLRDADGVISQSPTTKNSSSGKTGNTSPESLDSSGLTTAEHGVTRSESQQSMADLEKATDSHNESDSPTLEEVRTTTSTVDPKKTISAEEDDEDDEEHIHTAVPPELLQSPGDTCAICIDTLEDNDDVRGLTCGHAFHASCLDPWLTSRRACCPLCKADYYVPKPRPEGEPAVEVDRDSRRSRRTDSTSRRMNMPQAPATGWIGARASPLRGGRMILPGRFMTNAMYPGDGYGYATGDGSGRRRRAPTDDQPMPSVVEHGAADPPAVDTSHAEGSWRSRVHVPNPFNNLRMPTIRIPGRSQPQNNAPSSNPTPAQLEEGTAP